MNDNELSEKSTNQSCLNPKADNQTKIIEALRFFKDWSNYLLVITVGALGWVTTTDVIISSPFLRTAMIACFTFSIMFGIFTLAMIPIITQAINEETTSFYEVFGKYKPFCIFKKEWSAKIKWFCWPQHFSFLAGIFVYAYATSDYLIVLS